MVSTNQLTELRADIANVLDEAGIRSVDFNSTKIVPPLAVVIPDDEYVTVQDGGIFGHYNVAIQVLLLGPKATEKVAAAVMDEMIMKAVTALDEEFDVINVSAPGEARLNDAVYFGSIINIEIQIKLEKG